MRLPLENTDQLIPHLCIIGLTYLLFLILNLFFYSFLIIVKKILSYLWHLCTSLMKNLASVIYKNTHTDA